MWGIVGYNFSEVTKNRTNSANAKEHDSGKRMAAD